MVPPPPTGSAAAPRRCALLLALLLGACDRGPKVVGDPADPATLSRDVQVLGEQTMGPVVLRGTVGQVCDTGCWFYLLDESSLVFVQLDLATGLTVPTDSQGEPVIVKGRIVDEAGQRVLHAETVVLGEVPGAD